jgi:hypothetical protein
MPDFIGCLSFNWHREIVKNELNIVISNFCIIYGTFRFIAVLSQFFGPINGKKNLNLLIASLYF